MSIPAHDKAKVGKLVVDYFFRGQLREATRADELEAALRTAAHCAAELDLSPATLKTRLSKVAAGVYEKMNLAGRSE